MGADHPATGTATSRLLKMEGEPSNGRKLAPDSTSRGVISPAEQPSFRNGFAVPIGAEQWAVRRRSASSISFLRPLLPVILLGGLLAGCGTPSTPRSLGLTPTTDMSTTVVPTDSSVTPDASSLPPETTANVPPSPQTPVTGPLTTPPRSKKIDPYLPAGVPDQIFPPGDKAYLLLSNGDCGELQRKTDKWSTVPDTVTALYSAAAHACLADWEKARSALQRIDTSTLCTDPNTGELYGDGSAEDFGRFEAPVEACEEQRLRVYRWTANLLATHDADPTFVPNFPTPPKR